MVDIKKIQYRLLERESEFLRAMPDRTDESIRMAMRKMAFEVAKIYKEVLTMKNKTRFKITRHAAGKTTTTKGGSKKMSAKPNMGGKVADNGTPDNHSKKKGKKGNLPNRK